MGDESIYCCHCHLFLKKLAKSNAQCAIGLKLKRLTQKNGLCWYCAGDVAGWPAAAAGSTCHWLAHSVVLMVLVFTHSLVLPVIGAMPWAVTL